MSDSVGQRYMDHSGSDNSKVAKRRVDVSLLTDAELEAEAQRRKELAQQSPKSLDNPDFSKLIETVTSIVEAAVKQQYFDSDVKHYIYEAAIEAVYGKEFWEWRRNQKW
jgi:hypothetical protein